MLSFDQRLVTAARYAYQFGLDVIAVLDTDTEDNRWMRAAALMVVDRDNREQEAKAKKR